MRGDDSLEGQVRRYPLCLADQAPSETETRNGELAEEVSTENGVSAPRLTILNIPRPVTDFVREVYLYTCLVFHSIPGEVSLA